MHTSENTVIDQPKFNLSDFVFPEDNDEGEFTAYAWRCTWMLVNGSKVEEAGSTYSFTRTSLNNFIDSFTNIVDETNPKMHYRRVSLKLVEITKEFFDELVLKTSSVIHVTKGFHPEDLEAAV